MKTLLLFCTGLFIAAVTQAQIIHVPGDFPSIQQGIDAATNGDTVLVSDGIYYEQINFLGKKPLMVASEFLTTGDSSHIANTIIDGSLIQGDSCSVVYFINGEDSTSVICGFTIQGGHGSLWEFWGMHGGGGIYCLNGASIVNNIIQNNEITVTVNNAGGGGILVISTSPVHVSDNSIRNNFVDCQSAGNTWSGGGGIFCVLSNGCRHFISGNLIEDNEVHTSSNYAAVGAGILLQECSAICENNTFKNNNSTHTGTGFGRGGAIVWYIYQNGSCIRNNSFLNNFADNFAGGINIETTSFNELLIENNYFLENHATAFGGAIETINSKVRLLNNVFISNQSGQMGGACYFRRNIMADHNSILINNSFNDNQSESGGAIYSVRTRPILLNSIFWNNTANTGPEMYLSGGDTVELAYTNINTTFIGGGTVIDGGGNIPGLDPLFISSDSLMLSDGSPCIDKGTDMYTCNHGITYYCPPYDIMDTIRPINAGFDMGAYEWYPNVGIPLYENNHLEANIYPNPTGGIVNCQLSIFDGQFVSVRLYDQVGREVGTMLEQQLEAGQHTLQFDVSKLPAGIYFWRLTIGNKQPLVGKMIRL